MAVLNPEVIQAVPFEYPRDLKIPLRAAEVLNPKEEIVIPPPTEGQLYPRGVNAQT